MAADAPVVGVLPEAAERRGAGAVGRRPHAVLAAGAQLAGRTGARRPAALLLVSAGRLCTAEETLSLSGRQADGSLRCGPA